METPQEDKLPEAGNKKGAYDDFSREELVKKCKHLLMIAQKSKQARTEVTAENTELKKRYEELQTESTSTKKDLLALQEIVESLTEQKLNFATELESHMKANNSLKSRIELINEKYEENVGALISKSDLLQNQVEEFSGKLTNYEIENTSLKRQNARLSDENESLLKQLEELEGQVNNLNKLEKAQRDQISKLENIATSVDLIGEEVLSNQRVTKDKQDVTKHEHEVLKDELVNVTRKYDELSELIKSKDDQITSLTDTLHLKEKLYSTEKDKKDKLHVRLKSYREKIVKCASSITQLKNSNLILLKTVGEYAKSVPKWQNDIFNASKLLSDQLLSFERENIALKDELRVAVESKRSEELNNEIDNLNAKFKELQNEHRQSVEDKQTLSQKLKSLETLSDTYLNKVRELECSKVTLESEEKNLKDLVTSLKESLVLKDHELVRYSEDTYELKRIIERLENEKGSLNGEIESLKNDKSGEEVVLNLKKEITKLRDSYKAMENENKSLMDTNELLQDEVGMLKMSFEAPNQEAGGLSELNASMQADVSKLETKLSAYKQENSSLLSELKDLGQKLSSAEAILKDSEEQKLRYSNYKIENAELLNEMKEINQVIKERGETISKQEKAISESERMIQLLEAEMENLKQSLEESKEAKSQAANELESFKLSAEEMKKEKEEMTNLISRLRGEKNSLDTAMEEQTELIALLKDELERSRQNNSFNDVQSEVMSTSTISKMEESSRLKELDDSFEERYNKLKSFAVKLKKKVDVLQTSLQNVEDEKASLEQTLDKLRKHASTGNETMEVGQSVAEYEKQINILRQENEKAVKKMGKLEEDLSRAVDEKVRVEMELGNLKTPRQEPEKGKDTDVLKLRADLEQRNAELSSLREQLEKARKDVKKSSVLSLEMADYERSMKEQGYRLEENKKKMAQMESTIDTHQATIVSLKTQIRLLEDQLKLEENQSREIKESLNRSSTTIEERDSVIAAKSDKVSQLERNLEDLKSANEELSIQMMSSLAEKEKLFLSVSAEKTELLQRLKKLDSRYMELEEKCHLRSSEYDLLVGEFNGYKMRAQSVLRQNQVKDHSQDETLQIENTTLRLELDTLKSKVEALKEECANLTSSLSLEKRRAADSSAATAKLRQLSDQFSSELQAARNESLEEKSRFNLQISTLTQCYKKQISELEERLQTETANLKKELSNAESRNAAKVGGRTHVASNSDGGSDSLDPEINVAMLQREEGEGSESSPPPFIMSGHAVTGSSAVDGNAKISRRSPLPLDRLLEEGVPDDLIGGENELRFVDMTPEQQLAETKKRLDTQEQRVQHVSLLLSESERESARLAEMCTLLKAEVRRLTRALDRHTHAHNPEYLKNVLFKFLTLSAGDERLRLVPVLNTILTLSPEETHKLDAVAKGVDPNSNRGWGSYLPWPGPR